MSIHLNREQINAWVGALEAVEENASNTDTESTGKYFIDAMARFVRDEPVIVVRLLTAV
jgi:hypothetical protein